VNGRAVAGRGWPVSMPRGGTIQSYNTNRPECYSVVSGYEKAFCFPRHQGPTKEIPTYCVDLIAEHAGMSVRSASPANCMLESRVWNTSQQVVCSGVSNERTERVKACHCC
jgi:hypothetical protein